MLPVPIHFTLMPHPSVSNLRWLMRGLWWRAVLWGMAMLVGPVLKAAPSESDYYDLAVGDAAVTLKQFVELSGEQVVYLVNRVRGVKTNEVNGEYLPVEALDLMLKGTGLVYVLDETSGAFTINREGDGTW